MTASCSIKDKIEQMPDYGGHLLFIIFAAFVRMEEEHYADQEENYDFNMQLTLEEHFSNLAQNGDGIKQLHNLWELLRADLASRLQTSKSVFIHYSLHDSTHSRTVISAIEMFLGRSG